MLDQIEQKFTLKNGIRVVYIYNPRPVSYCGLIINTGSRDEINHPIGVAHFLEHMFFKGTEKRKAHHILNRIDEVGGELNAYTAKENTFVYTSFLSEHIDRALDIMSDITFHSTFPKHELEKERIVILDEFQSYKDDPAEELGDEFDSLMFKNHTLGNNILGSPETVNNMQSKHLHDFLRKTYHTDEMLICFIGNTPYNKFCSKIEQYFGHIKSNLRNYKRTKFNTYKPFQKQIEKEMYSSHALIGNIAYSIRDKQKLSFVLLNNILGGPSLNNRLNMNIREKYGYTYYLDSSYTPFEDCGQWLIYLSTDQKNLDRTIELVYKELDKLKTTSLSSIQLSKAKKQLMGQMALVNENTSGMLHVIAKSQLIFNYMDSLEKIYTQIDKITSSQLLEVANDIFNIKKISELIYRNKK